MLKDRAVLVEPMVREANLASLVDLRIVPGPGRPSGIRDSKVNSAYFVRHHPHRRFDRGNLRAVNLGVERTALQPNVCFGDFRHGDSATESAGRDSRSGQNTFDLAPVV